MSGEAVMGEVMSDELVLEGVMRYRPLEVLLTQIREALRPVMEGRHGEDRYEGPVYRDGNICKLRQVGRRDIAIKLKKYTGVGIWFTPIEGYENGEGEPKPGIMSSVAGIHYCVNRLYADAYDRISNVKLQQGKSELIFMSAPLAPEEVFASKADEISHRIIEKNGWYVTFVTERQKWDMCIHSGILAGVILYNWDPEWKEVDGEWVAL